MDGEDRSPVQSGPRRRKLALRVAVPVAILGAAVGAILLESLVAGRPHHPVTQVVRCDSIISFVQVGASPPEVSGGRRVRLPGGGGLACGQLEVQPGGSEPVAVDLWTGTIGLSATMAHVGVATLDLMNYGPPTTRMSFLPRQECLLMLEEDPNQAHMFIYSANRLSMVLSLHLIFGPGS